MCQKQTDRSAKNKRHRVRDNLSRIIIIRGATGVKGVFGRCECFTAAVETAEKTSPVKEEKRV